MNVNSVKLNHKLISGPWVVSHEKRGRRRNERSISATIQDEIYKNEFDAN
jgi:exoribonuclease II